ncbi:uncharacterized protein LOC131953908 [Physella acuta]|uniref:uncharacterized protein LOC131953908 n=1 Tax=Physella acuta TaxID=109671 RepID=UPI0027DBB916|nr:uncharacterized protein LOC131953908 [Physella acuta]
MEEFKINYSEFHKDFTRFTEQLPSTFMKGVPADFEVKLKLVPTYLTVKDPEFANENLKDIVKRWYYLQEVIEKLLTLMVQLVKSASRAWYQGQKDKLEWWMFLVQTSVELMKRDPRMNTADLVVISSGIGGVNSGTIDQSRSIELQKIKVQVDEFVRILESMKKPGS